MPTGLDQLWVADITYVRMLEEFAFLAVVLDAFSRRVIGWALDTHLRASLATTALQMAIAARRPAPDSLIHHSDRGVQYACGEYTGILETHGIQPSMSRVGNPYDNAKAESFMKTLKQEEVDGRDYRNLSQARDAIGAFIETSTTAADSTPPWPIGHRSSSNKTSAILKPLRIHRKIANLQPIPSFRVSAKGGSPSGQVVGRNRFIAPLREACCP